MPMMPGPLAAIVYTAIKVGGYALYARGANKLIKNDNGAFAHTCVGVYKFGAAKTVLGLGSGILFTILISAFHAEPSDLEAWLWFTPVRVVTWGLVLGYFYNLHRQPKVMAAAILAGVFWSYVLDLIMWPIYKAVPGMAMGIC